MLQHACLAALRFLYSWAAMINIYFYFYFNIKREVVMARVLLISVDMHQFNHTFSRAHMERHTHKHACMISAQEEWPQPVTGAWLGGAEERVVFRDKSLVQQKMTAHRDLKSRRITIRGIELPSKLLDCFLSINSFIHTYVYVCMYICIYVCIYIYHAYTYTYMYIS